MSYSHCQCMENSSLLSYIHCIYSSLFLQCEAQHNLIFEAKSKEKIDIAFLQCSILLLHQRGFNDSMETHKNAHMKMITTIHGKVGCKLTQTYIITTIFLLLHCTTPSYTLQVSIDASLNQQFQL